LHVTDVQIGLYASIGVVVTAFGGTLCGLASDKFGNRLVLLAASAAGLVASAYALIVPTPQLLGVVFAFSAFAVAGSGLAGYNITMEFAPTEKDVPHYTAFYNAVVSPVRAIAFISGGIISQRLNFTDVFIISTVAAALSVAFTMRLVEPKKLIVSGRLEEPGI
jgi:MFS family permease